MKGGSMTPGAVVLFVNLMNFIISPIAELPGLLACRKAALGLVDKLAAALERSSSREGSETLNRLENGIRLENVSFADEPGKTVLHGINAEFEAGRAYALVGGSGSGKSTPADFAHGGGNKLQRAYPCGRNRTVGYFNGVALRNDGGNSAECFCF